MQAVTATVARATIAHLMIGPAAPDTTVAGIALHPHQHDAVGLLRMLLEHERGALLADDVGLGKTFTALALARGSRMLAIVPAALSEAWLDAARRMDVALELITVEALSRGALPTSAPELVVIDEAHHLRNPATRRFAVARRICSDARVLLLTATPVQNSERDLRVILSLFLGERAHALGSTELARYVVRRTAETIGPAASLLPSVDEPHWLDHIDDSDCLDRILGLPPAVPPRGSGDAGMLGAYSLVRQWASSRAALDAALRRRLARGLALADALRSGRLPSRTELAAWVHADGDQQLAFPELLISAADASSAALLTQVDEHLGGLRRLLDWLCMTPDPDALRVARLRSVLSRHPGQRVVAFSEYAETVTALFTRLLPHARVAMLTHTGGRVAGGPISRREVLARFTPGITVPEAERVELLLATDVLSEGVGLHAASILVHLDLAWNPGRLAQRVGRLRRLGAPSEHVSVYLVPPPAATERLLRVESRLRHKLGSAGRTVGVAGTIMPGMTRGADSAAENARRIASLLAAWRTGDVATAGVVAAVRGAAAGALICVRDAERARLLAWDGVRITDDADAIERMIAVVDAAPAMVPDAQAATRVADDAREWLDRHRLGAAVDLTALRVARSRRFVLHRADGISRRLPRHARVRVASLVRAARAAATATLSAGAERVLDELARAPLADEAWLQAVGEFARLHASQSAPELRVEVVVLVTPDRA